MSELPVEDLANRLALTVAEAAEAIGVSERHLRSALNEVPHLHIGRRLVIPVDGFREWLRDRARQSKGRVDEAVDEIMGGFDRGKEDGET